MLLPPPSTEWGANQAPEAHSTARNITTHPKLACLLGNLLAGTAKGAFLSEWGLLKAFRKGFPRVQILEIVTCAI